MRDQVVRQAILNVVSRHPEDEWWALPARQRAQAIYDEIRRLDSRRVNRKNTQPSESADKELAEVI